VKKSGRLEKASVHGHAVAYANKYRANEHVETILPEAILVQAAQAAARMKNSYLSAQYHQIAARRGTKRAAVAVGHSILVIYYHMLTTGEAYQEKGANYFSELDRKHAERRATRQLERLGYQVTLTPTQIA